LSPTLANPKSQIFKSQFSLTSIFAGFYGINQTQPNLGELHQLCVNNLNLKESVMKKNEYELIQVVLSVITFLNQYQVNL
jgi:hypothetical protein